MLIKIKNLESVKIEMGNCKILRKTANVMEIGPFCSVHDSCKIGCVCPLVEKNVI